MTCLFADLSLRRLASALFHRTLFIACFSQIAFVRILTLVKRLMHLGNAAQPRPRETEREQQMRHDTPQRQRSYSEVAAPRSQPLLRRCSPLVMRIAMSLIDCDWRRTDEASRPQVGRIAAGSSGLASSPPAPLALRSCAAGLVSARQTSRVDSVGGNLVGLAGQSKRFFAGLKCGGLMARA
jgi:hypothetical protein